MKLLKSWFENIQEPNSSAILGLWNYHGLRITSMWKHTNSIAEYNIRSSFTRAVKLTCDVSGGTRFHENDRQLDVYYNHRHHIFYTANASTKSADGQESGVGKTLRLTPRSPSIEKGCFSLSERRRSFRCLGDPVIHPSIHLSIANEFAKCDSLPRQRGTTTTTPLVILYTLSSPPLPSTSFY